MLASSPASTVNQKRPDLGIPNRFDFTSSRSSGRGDCEKASTWFAIS